MQDHHLALLRAALRDIPDFPQPGIVFKDITPLLADGALFRLATDAVIVPLVQHHIQKVVAIDARGFIFAGAACDRLGIGLVPVRKKGKLPWDTVARSYDLEYGSNVIEMHRDAIQPGERVWLVDDVLATGGTAAAAAEVVRELGGVLAGMTFIVELGVLGGRGRLPEGVPVHSVLSF